MVYFGLPWADSGCYDNDGLIEFWKEDELEEMPQIRWDQKNYTVNIRKSQQRQLRGFTHGPEWLDKIRCSPVTCH